MSTASQPPSPEAPSPQPPSLLRIISVVRRNPAYRRLFAANAISQVGDWFSLVALFALLLELTGKGESVALAILCRNIPMFLAGPIAGVVADRWSRRATMVISDVLRCALTLGLILIRRPDQVAWIYALCAAHAFVSAFFEPAQQATFPNLVEREDLVVASAIDNTLWATCLAVGSALGGMVLVRYGRAVVFAVDAATFVASAALIRGLPDGVARARAGSELPVPRREGWAQLLGLNDMADGIGYLRDHPRVRALILVKAGFGFTLGGVLVLLAFFGEEVFGAGGSGIAVLWTARGVGSFAGPFIAWWLGGDSPQALRRGITISYLLIGSCYVAFGSAPSLAFAALALAVANAGGSILWTYGSTLQQLMVPDHFRGRVFATDMGLLTLTLSLSTLWVGHLLDIGTNPRWLIAACGLVTLGPITLWLSSQPLFEGAPATPPAPS